MSTPGSEAPAERQRLAEVARFLRTRRAKLTPEEFGLPMSPRRRARGLLREEVAALAGLSTTWYTYLEQGRPISPSRAVLDSLARTLRLDPDERRYLHLMVSGQPPPAGSGALATSDADLARRLVQVIGHGQHPFYVGNQYGDIVDWNDEAAAWYTDFGTLPDGRRNMLWWLVRDPLARERLVDWAQETRDVVGRLRAAYASRPHDRRLYRLIRELRAQSLEFRRWWDEQHVAESRSRLRRLRAPGLGVRTFRLVALRLGDDPFTSVIVHLPHEEANGGAGPEPAMETDTGTAGSNRRA